MTKEKDQAKVAGWSQPATTKWNKSIALYGPPGSGKTTLAVSLRTNQVGEKASTIIVDADNKARGTEAGVLAEQEGRLQIWVPKSPLTSETLLETVSKYGYPHKKPEGFLEIVDMLNMAMDKNPDVIVLDSMTRTVEHMSRLIRHLSQSPAITLPGWGKYMEFLEAIFNQMTAWEGIFICCAHELLEKDDILGKIWFKPLVSGQMKDKMAQYFHEVYHLEKELKGGKKSFSLRTFADSRYVTRSSHKDLPPHVEMDLQELMEFYYKGAKK